MLKSSGGHDARDPRQARPEGSTDVRTVLHSYPERALDQPSRAARLAAWINAYNRLIAGGILALGIQRTVWEIPDFFDRIALRTGPLIFTANDIEHGVLRGNRPNPLSGAAPFSEHDPRRHYGIVPLEPRIHFAINCGARSCPPISLYHAETLEDEMEDATRRFVNREVALEGSVVRASPIFQWFGVDFADSPGGLVGFLSRYLTDASVRHVLAEGGEAAISWRAYDWSVADQSWAGD
jgi:hypothetical protein